MSFLLLKCLCLWKLIFKMWTCIQHMCACMDRYVHVYVCACACVHMLVHICITYYCIVICVVWKDFFWTWKCVCLCQPQCFQWYKGMYMKINVYDRELSSLVMFRSQLTCQLNLLDNDKPISMGRWDTPLSTALLIDRIVSFLSSKN